MPLLPTSQGPAEKGSSVTASAQNLSERFQPQALTDVCDVEREPEEERVADQLRKEQAQGELDHTLKESEPADPKGAPPVFTSGCD